ncbi:hypothetical protein DA89_3371 [Vibrio cholerae]|nr:hypothetical protein DA89_3371 [Vibrio cholerae]
MNITYVPKAGLQRNSFLPRNGLEALDYIRQCSFFSLTESNAEVFVR